MEARWVLLLLFFLDASRFPLSTLTSLFLSPCQQIFSYPGTLAHHEARKYVCAIHTGLIWAEEDLLSLFRRRRVDSIGSSSVASSASLDQLVTPRTSVVDLAGREEVGVVGLDSDQEGEGEGSGSRVLEEEEEGECA